jgi:5'-methylthioadenosine phosphorylase
VTPGFDEGLRLILLRAAENLNLDIVKHGVYVQSKGPRLETPAEVRFFSSLGDVVGMTVASEATLAKEVGVGYACICSVDNYANGMSPKPLGMEEILDNAVINTNKIVNILKEAVSILNGV